MPEVVRKLKDVRRLRGLEGLLFVVLSMGLSLGCEGPRTAWSAESRSPDGKMVATARAEETSGIGTGNPGTFVYLNWAVGSQSSTLILGLLPQQPGIVRVEMNWLTATHLELTYRGQMTVDFQAVRCHGIEISVRELSGDTGGAGSNTQ